MIGSRAPHDCEVIRLTIKDDLTTPAGLATALSGVSDTSVPVLLFGALPCTGGSPWQHINWNKGGLKTKRKILAHWAVFRKLWAHFQQVADACIAHGGHVALEWPRSCMYWRHQRVKSALRRWGTIPHPFDGCMYGLVSQAARSRGVPLRKPWTVASTCDEFIRLRRTCDKSHAHVATAGSDTRRTESYTALLVDEIHSCWLSHCSSPGVAGAGGHRAVAERRAHSTTGEARSAAPPPSGS